MGGSRGKALVIATYEYEDPGLRGLAAPGHDAEALAAVLADPDIAGLDVSQLVNETSSVVAEAIDDFYAGCRRDELTVLYFSGHGVKDDQGALYLAMRNTRRQKLRSTGLSAGHLSAAMDDCPSRRKVLVLDCCYSGAFPTGRTAKADEGVHTLERFQGKGRVVLTASDSTQYAFEGDDVRGSGTSSLFTRYLVEGIRTGAADADQDGDIALDELYGYVHERVVADMPQQRPKKQEDVDGRILIARNVHWTLPAYLRHAIESPIAAQRRIAVDQLGHLHRVGNDVVRSAALEQLRALATDDSRSVSSDATALLERIGSGEPGPPPPARAPVPTPRRVAVDAAAHAPALPAPTAAPPEPARAATRPEPGDRSPVGWALAPLLVVAGVLLTVSRFLVFESVNGYHAIDMYWTTAGWVLQALLPLLLALGALLARPGASSHRALAAGVAAGVLLNLVGQLAMSAVVTLDPDVGYALGPAWWVILVAALVLTGAVAAASTTPAVRARPGVARHRSAALGGAVVLAAGIGWILVGPVSTDFGWWLYLRIAGLLLTAACLAVAVLDLAPEQRLLGLAAVTTTGLWLAGGAVEALAVRPDGAQTGPLLLTLVLALVPVGGAVAAQVSGRHRAGEAARR